MIQKPTIIRLNVVPASNFGGKRSIKPTHITDHHIVGDSPAAIAEAKKPERQMSFTFTVSSKGEIFQLLEFDEIPYTDGSSTSNRRAITIEHAGGHPSVPYTEAMYKATIHLHAWLRQELNIPESNILRHRDVSDNPTACPGGLDVERIKKESTNLLKGENTMTEELARALAKWGRLLGFNSVEKMNANSENDVKQIMANPMYAAALLEQLYKGEWQVPAWKANNYESNGKTQYNKGYVDGQAASGGDLPVGTYLKVDKANIIEVKEK